MILLLITLILAGVLWVIYKSKPVPHKFDRIESDGGSFLISRQVMSFGYWVMELLASVFMRLGMSPNAISFLSLVLVGGCSFFLIQNSFQWAAVFYWLSCACDTCDGQVARRTQKASDAGEVVDATIDRWVDIIVFSTFVVMYRSHDIFLGISLLALAGSVMVSYATAKAEALKTEIPRGVMRRAERAVYVGIAILFTPWVDGLGLPYSQWHPFIILVLFLIGVLANASAIFRLWVLYSKLKKI